MMSWLGCIICCGYDFSYPQGCAGHLMSWLGMLSYVVGTNFRTRMAVVVFDVVVGLFRMLWVRIFVPARLCVTLDVVVRMLSYIVGTNFRARKAVVVFDVVVGLYRMLWVRILVPAGRRVFRGRRLHFAVRYFMELRLIL